MTCSTRSDDTDGVDESAKFVSKFSLICCTDSLAGGVEVLTFVALIAFAFARALVEVEMT